LLKQLENLSDERVVLQFKRNPYYQYFCGYSNYIRHIIPGSVDKMRMLMVF
jgi:IS5 family transposase